MKKMLTAIVLFCLVFIFSGCSSRYKSIKTTIPENNPTYKIHYLFEYEGVKMYRFYDNERYVYFTIPAGMVSSHQGDSIKTAVRTMMME